MASSQGYNPLSLLLHWFTVVWVLIMWPAGVMISQWGNAPDFVYDMHVTFGVCGAAFIVFRIVHRLAKGFAPANQDHARWERFLARLVQWVFLIALTVLVVTGLLKAFSGGSLFLWGGNVPRVFKFDKQVWEVIDTIHPAASMTLAVSMMLHIGGALKHAVLSRDGTLMRILKPTSPGK